MSDLKQIHQDIQLWMGDYDVPMRQDAYDALAMMLETYSHRTQPEATKPAQDLSAAILEQAAQACDQQADGTNGAYRTACLQCANAVRELRDAALASSSDALVGGDRVDAERYRHIRNNSRGDLYSALYCNKAELWDSLIDFDIQAQKDGHG